MVEEREVKKEAWKGGQIASLAEFKMPEAVQCLRRFFCSLPSLLAGSEVPRKVISLCRSEGNDTVQFSVV